jgi:CDP-paratose 2-epimerase
VIGIDNDMRAKFFGPEGSVKKNRIEHENYIHHDLDIAEAHKILSPSFDLIIHCAAQPSHDWSAKNPLLDFGVNAVGTLLLLEGVRQQCPHAVFIFASTNKVYGDNPNKLTLHEGKNRYHADIAGIDESMSLDHCVHSVFGVSKTAADLMCQEYGKNFGLKTGIFRCGCITGGRHAGVELHGFLSYVVKCKKAGKVYKIYGYKGKQVRDNIHARDLVNAFDHFFQNPRPGEAYNMGGGENCNLSVLEALKIFNVPYDYIDEARVGDHIWYISDVSKFQNHYPGWRYEMKQDDILEDLIQA